MIDEDGFEPTGLWRSTYVAADGAEKVWAEASDEEEVRASLSTAPSPWGLKPRLYQLWSVRHTEWRQE